MCDGQVFARAVGIVSAQCWSQSRNHKLSCHRMSRQVHTSSLRVFLRWANRERRPSNISGDNDPAGRRRSSHPQIVEHLPHARLRRSREPQELRSSRSHRRRHSGSAQHPILREHRRRIKCVWAQTPDRDTAEWPVAVKNPSFPYGCSMRSVAEAFAFSPNAPNRTAKTAKFRPIDAVERRMRITNLQRDTPFPTPVNNSNCCATPAIPQTFTSSILDVRLRLRTHPPTNYRLQLRSNGRLDSGKSVTVWDCDG